MEIRWRNVLILVVGIVLLVCHRTVRDVLRRIFESRIWAGFCEEFAAMPRLGHFCVVLMVLALLYITVYMLLLTIIRRRDKP